ncbi:MAG: hypothetical protein IKM31_11575 [Oscillospiraceae bacterium]|nr:hypothetical protein [Oscillospiraceae bacterium]
MKRCWLVMLCCLLLSGCVRVGTLQDLAVIQGAAVDYADGQLELTLQVFSADGPGGQTILDPSKQNAKMISCKGNTIAEALSQTSLSQGRSFFLGHDRLLILGDGTRELALSDLLEEITGSLGLREDVIVLAAEGKAADVLGTDVNQGVLPAITIEQTVENAADEGRIPEVRLLDLSRSLAEGHRSAVVPVISLPERDEGELETFLLSGAAVYAGDDYREVLSGDALSGLLFFGNRVREMPLTAGGKSWRIYHCESRLIPAADFAKEKRFTLQVKGKAAYLGPRAAVTEEELIRAEDLLEERVRECCRTAFDQAAAGMGCDILGLGDVLRRRQPEVFRTLNGEWPDRIRDISVDYAVEIAVDRFREN